MTRNKWFMILVPVLIASVLLASFTILLIGFAPPVSGEPVITTVRGNTGTAKEYRLSDLKDLTPVTGTCEFENQLGNWRDYGEYTGIKLSELVEEAGGMRGTDIIKVTAGDGYSAYYTYENIYPAGDMATYQGNMILAYMFNGTEVPDYEDGPRIAFLPSDQKYSNDDMVMTTSIESRGSAPSGGSRWIKDVAEIDVISEQYMTVTNAGYTETYTLSQLRNMPLTTGSGGYKRNTGTISGPFEYTGVNLTYLFTDLGSLPSNYTVNITASDGWITTLTKNETTGLFNTYDVSGNTMGVQKLVPIIAYGSTNPDFSPFVMAFVNPVGTGAGDLLITDSTIWAKKVVEIEIFVV